MIIRSAILAAALGAALATPALAEPQSGRASVSYSDLDLATEAGRTELGKRFDQAAREMCGVKGAEAAPGRERYCYQKNSAQLSQRAAAIIKQRQEALGG